MPYGIQVETTQGVANLADIPSARLLELIVISTTSGSMPAPPGTASIFVKLRSFQTIDQFRVFVRLIGSDIVWGFSGSQPPTGFEFDVLCFSGLN